MVDGDGHEEALTLEWLDKGLIYALHEMVR